MRTESRGARQAGIPAAIQGYTIINGDVTVTDALSPASGFLPPQCRGQ